MQSNEAENAHRSVLLEESCTALEPQNGGTFVDATMGLGGHTEALLAASPETRVIGIDQDADAIGLAKKRLKRFASRLEIFQANFSEIDTVVEKAGFGQPSGIIADLGVSSMQLDSETRGFSFRFDAPLDMRMNATSDIATAADLLATLSESEIADIIYLNGEERASRRIARRIVGRRESGDPVATTFQLANLVAGCVRRGKKDKVHPATRTFQALRIAVNGELDILERFIDTSIDILQPEGTLALITFHSLEDRIVKRAFLKNAGRCSCPPRMPKCMCGAVKRVQLLTKKPQVPTETEMNENPRSRSAKLRACRKLDV
jgi:16S rRNA (cytosine1402-N4)-methyltransferase